MAYYEHLRSLLRPLKLYDLDRGPGRAELFAEGKAMDRVYEALEAVEREAIPTTASGYGLERYEEILPFLPVCSQESDRRAAICALLRIDDSAFTAVGLNSTIAGCGIGAVVTEGDEADTVTVKILNTRGVPGEIDAIKRRMEQILPCHLEIVYAFNYSTWQEMEAALASWQEIETLALDWQSFEIYTE